MQQCIREVYSFYPSLQREKLLLIRTLIFDVAKQTPDVGEIEEGALKIQKRQIKIYIIKIINIYREKYVTTFERRRTH